MGSTAVRPLWCMSEHLPRLSTNRRSPLWMDVLRTDWSNHRSRDAGYKGSDAPAVRFKPLRCVCGCMPCKNPDHRTITPLEGEGSRGRPHTRYRVGRNQGVYKGCRTAGDLPRSGGRATAPTAQRGRAGAPDSPRLGKGAISPRI